MDFNLKYIKYKLKYIKLKNNILTGGINNKKTKNTIIEIYRSKRTNNILYKTKLVKILNNLQENEEIKYNNSTYIMKNNEIIKINKNKNNIEYDFFTKDEILYKKIKFNKIKNKPFIIKKIKLCDNNDKIIDGIEWFTNSSNIIFNDLEESDIIYNLKNTIIDNILYFIHENKIYYLHSYSKNIGYNYYFYIIVDEIKNIIFLKILFFNDIHISQNQYRQSIILSQTEKNIIWNQYFLHNYYFNNTKSIITKNYYYDIVDILRLYGYVNENYKMINKILFKLFKGKCIPINNIKKIYQ